MALPIVGVILGGLGTAVKAFFGFRQAQANVVQSALDVLGDVNRSDADRAHAAALAIAADARSESWITRVWRPLTMFLFLVLVVSYWFGFYPPNMLGPMPPIIARIFDIVEIVVLAGYPARTLEKIAREMNIGMVLKKLIEKTL